MASIQKKIFTGKLFKKLPEVPGVIENGSASSTAGILVNAYSVYPQVIFFLFKQTIKINHISKRGTLFPF